MKTLNLFVNEVRMLFWTMKRYIFNTLAGIGVMFLIFMGMFWGVRAIGGAGVSGESLDSMLVGYILWMSAMLSMQSTGSEILSESQGGTLEQLYLSPMGAHRIFFFRALVNILFNFVFITVLLYLSMAATGRWMAVNLPFLYLMVLLSTVSLVGISFMLGGIGLIHKRIGAVNRILSVGLIGMMVRPTYPLTIYAFLPFIAGASTVNRAVVADASFPLWWYLFIGANSAFYLFMGLSVFRMTERKARQLNKMGQY
jgi:ABC-2 type transport system permease protein